MKHLISKDHSRGLFRRFRLSTRDRSTVLARSNRPTNDPGFTLIELLAVLALMAVLSSAAAVVLSGPRHAADLRDSIDQISLADASARTLARSIHTDTVLEISIATGRVIESGGSNRTVLAQLPGDVKIERIRTAGSITDFGSRTINYDSRGCSGSYAIRLVGSTGEKQWIVFAGLSGQMLKVNDDQIDAIFQNISPGNDAH